MNKEDFKFEKLDIRDGHIDYWFDINGETEKELTNKYMEMCMVGITGAVYSEDEDIVGIRRQFHWNYDVIVVDDEALKDVLKSIIRDLSAYKECFKR